MKRLVLLFLLFPFTTYAQEAQDNRTETEQKLESRIIDLEKLVNTQQGLIQQLQKQSTARNETPAQTKERLKSEAKSICDLWDKKVYTINVTDNKPTIVCR